MEEINLEPQVEDELSEKVATFLAEALNRYTVILKSLASSEEGPEGFGELQVESSELALGLLEIGRHLAKLGEEVFGNGPRSPLVLEPLIQALGESYGLIALSHDPQQLSHLPLLDSEELDGLLTPEVLEWLKAYGVEATPANA